MKSPNKSPEPPAVGGGQFRYRGSRRRSGGGSDFFVRPHYAFRDMNGKTQAATWLAWLFPVIYSAGGGRFCPGGRAGFIGSQFQLRLFAFLTQSAFA